MMKSCFYGTTGDKENKGIFIERDPKVSTAGKPSLQPNQTVADCFKQNADHGRLYDVMYKNPAPDTTSMRKSPGYQTNRNYSKPPYNPNIIFGTKIAADRRGYKCCMTDDRVTLGTLNKPIPPRQADFVYDRQSHLGATSAPIDNISNVPSGYSFGTCEMNPDRDYFKKCLGYLNTLRKCLKKRFDDTFFNDLYLYLKYYDKTKSGWLPKELVYQLCSIKFISFDTSLIEPILATWHAFDGRQIEYKKLVSMLNHTQPTPELPKVWDLPEDCIDFRTTYSEMTKPGQKIDMRLMAGLPSGRYFELDNPVAPLGCCKADRVYLPYESHAKCSLTPSKFTMFGVSLQDMYAKRDPETLRKIFETALKVKFTDDKFESVWQQAKSFHSQEWVCYETFKWALNKLQDKMK